MDKASANQINRLLEEIRERLTTIETLVGQTETEPGHRASVGYVTRDDLIKFGGKNSKQVANRLWNALTGPLPDYFAGINVPLEFFFKVDGYPQPVAKVSWEMGLGLLISVRSIKAAAPFAQVSCVRNFGGGQLTLLKKWAEQL